LEEFHSGGFVYILLDRWEKTADFADGADGELAGERWAEIYTRAQRNKEMRVEGLVSLLFSR
jgi:hypothetical protein